MESTYLRNIRDRLNAERDSALKDIKDEYAEKISLNVKSIINPISSSNFFVMSLLVSVLSFVITFFPSVIFDFEFIANADNSMLVITVLSFFVNFFGMLCVLLTTLSNSVNTFVEKNFIGVSAVTILGGIVFYLFLVFSASEGDSNYYLVCVLLSMVTNYLVSWFCDKINPNLKKDLEIHINELENECDKECTPIIREYEEKFKREENIYTKKVSNAISEYSKSDVIHPTANWLADDLQEKLSSAKKDRNIKYIEATLLFKVEEKQIERLRKKTDTVGYTVVSEYVFYEKGFYDITDFFKRVGLAKVLARLVENEMKQRILNGSLPVTFADKTQIEIENDDSFVIINFKTLNPNYKPLVDIKHNYSEDEA